MVVTMATKGKSANPDLGAIKCDACDGFAAIRRQKTGRQYLYLHCPNCGMDKRSGEKLQAKWEKAISEPNANLSAIDSEVSPSVATENQPLKMQHELKPDEWHPEHVIQAVQSINNETKETETDDESNRTKHETDRSISSNGEPSNGFKYFIAGTITGLFAIAGIRASAS